MAKKKAGKKKKSKDDDVSFPRVVLGFLIAEIYQRLS